MLHFEEQRKKLLRARSNSTPELGARPSGSLSSNTLQRARANSQRLSPHEILHLQSTIGNQHVQRMLSKGSHGGVPQIQCEDEEELPITEAELEDEQTVDKFLSGDQDLPPGSSNTRRCR